MLQPVEVTMTPVPSKVHNSDLSLSELTDGLDRGCPR